MQYTKHHYVYVRSHSLTVFSVFRKILKLHTIDGAYLVDRQSTLRNYSRTLIYNKELTHEIH